MIEKIPQSIEVELETTEQIDLTSATDVRFYIWQNIKFIDLPATVMEAKKVQVAIPYADAMRLSKGYCSIQVVFTEPDGTARATETLKILVGELLNPEGYGGDEVST